MPNHARLTKRSEGLKVVDVHVALSELVREVDYGGACSLFLHSGRLCIRLTLGECHWTRCGRVCRITHLAAVIGSVLNGRGRPATTAVYGYIQPRMARHLQA